MTLDMLLDRVELERPNAWTRPQLTAWASDLEASLWTHILLQPQGLWRPYDHDRDGHTRLLLPDGWLRLYTSYLFAMIDLANGEFDRYQNSMAIYNGFFAELGAWYASAFAPAHRSAAWTELGSAAYDEMASGARLGILPAGAALLAVAYASDEAFAGEGAVTLRLTDGTALGKVDIIQEPKGCVRALALPYGDVGIEVKAPDGGFTAGQMRLSALVQPAAAADSIFA